MANCFPSPIYLIYNFAVSRKVLRDTATDPSLGRGFVVKAIQMEQKNIKLDENWVTPAALADELGVVRSTVTNWIKRNQVDYYVLNGALIRRHLVDRRTAPGKRAVGKPPQKAK